MANVTVTFTITEFCLYTGVSEEELHEIVGLGVIEPHDDETFDDHALTVMRRAVRLRQELELDWPGIAVALTLLEENAHLRQENRLLRQPTVSLYQPSLVSQAQGQHGAGPLPALNDIAQ
ncbi:chaperone-modulator protein CbpM [Citrobacter freundii]|nr:chaperone-modulator protein CbpM [Citrobacter freundii]